MSTEPEAHLTDLVPRFLEACRLNGAGRTDEAVEAFQEVLRAEPRLAEPRLELARVHYDRGQYDDAEVAAREAIRILDAGGQWTDEVPENVLLSMAWSLLGEIIRAQASVDEVVFGEPERFHELIQMSRAAFLRAAELDPEDVIAALNAAEMGEDPEEPLH